MICVCVYIIEQMWKMSLEAWKFFIFLFLQYLMSCYQQVVIGSSDCVFFINSLLREVYTKHLKCFFTTSSS